MKALDIRSPSSLARPAKTLVALLRQSGVKASDEDVRRILGEILNNREKAYKNLKNITDSILEFKRVAKR